MKVESLHFKSRFQKMNKETEENSFRTLAHSLYMYNASATLRFKIYSVFVSSGVIPTFLSHN